MAIAFDVSSFGQSLASTTCTVAHTCTGSNLTLVAYILTTGTITGVTYNSVAMTSIGTSGSMTAYYLKNPSTGTNNIVATTSIASNTAVIGTSYTGTKQTGGVDASATGLDSTASDANMGVTTTVNNCWQLAGDYNALNQGFNNGITNGISRSNNVNVTGTNFFWAGDTNAVVSPAGSSSIQGNYPGSNKDNYWISVSLAPSGIDYSMTAALGTFSLTGVAANLLYGRFMSAAVGSFALTGIDAALSRGFGIVASAGSFVLTGIDAAFRFSGWSNQSKNSASFSNQSKSAATFSNQSKNSGTWANQTKN